MPSLFNLPQYKKDRRELRNNRSIAEIVLWGYLRNRQLRNFRFRRQFGIGPFIVDFYCPLLELAIEVDGDSHFEKQQKSYDKQRTHWLIKHGIRILRFTNQEVFQDTHGVLEKLSRYIQNLPTPLLAKEGNAQSPFLPFTGGGEEGS